MADDYRQLIKKTILDEATFLRAVFKGRQKGQPAPWAKVNLRPVLIKSKRHLQFSYFDQYKDITKNYIGAQAIEKLDELLALAFRNIHVATRQGNLQVQVTKKGKVLIHKNKGATQQEPADLSHDQQKNYLLPANKPDPFLQAIGIMSQEGRIKAHMQAKFRQINAFLAYVQSTGELETFSQFPIQVVDFGCGNAYLTFAVYYYLNQVLGLPTHLTGVDVKANLVKKHSQKSQELGWPNITFQTGKIIDFQPVTNPDIVLALHACDTATDEALAQAITYQSKLIFCAPCCHHHLQQQFNQHAIAAPFNLILRHGILKERQGDILTDAFRASILRLMGYQTEVVEFISTEHTAKNLMIRAIKSTDLPIKKLRQEYQALKTFWGVTPYLETLLGEELTARL